MIFRMAQIPHSKRCPGFHSAASCAPVGVLSLRVWRRSFPPALSSCQHLLSDQQLAFSIVPPCPRVSEDISPMRLFNPLLPTFLSGCCGFFPAISPFTAISPISVWSPGQRHAWTKCSSPVAWLEDIPWDHKPWGHESHSLPHLCPEPLQHLALPVSNPILLCPAPSPCVPQLLIPHAAVPSCHSNPSPFFFLIFFCGIFYSTHLYFKVHMSSEMHLVHQAGQETAQMVTCSIFWQSSYSGPHSVNSGNLPKRSL